MKLPSLLLFIAVLWSSCDKNLPPNTVGQTSDLDLTFTLTYGGAPLEFGKTYQYVGRPISFDEFAFYISNIKLSKDDDGVINKIEVSEIEHLDFVSQQSITISLQNIPVGNYQLFEMNLGVSEDFNTSVPSDFGRSHPLNDTSMYRVDWGSYIFTKLVGKYDSELAPGWDIDFNYLTANASSLEPYSVLKSFSVEKDAKTSLKFEIEVDKIFGTDASNLINITENPTTEIENNEDLMMLIMENFSKKAIYCL